MQRQAVPLVRSEAPVVGTGMEYRAAVDAGDVTTAVQAGAVTSVTADLIDIAHDDGTYKTYRLAKFRRSNQGSSINQRPLVKAGDRVEKGTPLADGPCTDKGEMALGKNLLVAFMPWEGHNYEDAIILSQRLVQDDILTSIHIEEHEVDARDTSLAPRRSPATSRTSAKISWPTWTSGASSASAPRSAPATSWSARSPRRARPS